MIPWDQRVCNKIQGDHCINTPNLEIMFIIPQYIKSTQ